MIQHRVFIVLLATVFVGAKPNHSVAKSPDIDGDCDTDLADFAAFQRCYSSSDQNCATADVNSDLEIDLLDLEPLAAEATGPLQVVYRVVVDPPSFLLTQAGQSVHLNAIALDSEGGVVDTPIRWSPNKPDVVTVDDAGNVTALIDVGSAQVFAEACGVRSAPTLGVLAEPAPGAVLVPDNQIVGNPLPVDPIDSYDLGYIYQVELSTPTQIPVGAFLIGTGERPLSGQAIEVTSNGATQLVRLEVVPFDELFSALRIDESLAFPLSDADPNPAITGADNHNSTTPPSPAVDPPTGGLCPDAPGVYRFTWGPLDCTAEGQLPALVIPPVFSLPRGSVRVDLVLDSSLPYLHKFVVTGDGAIAVTLAPTLDVSFSGKLTCERVLKTHRIRPLPGWFKPLGGMNIPMGAGFELEARVIGPQVGIKLQGSAQFSFSFGFDCTHGTCQMVRSITGDTNTQMVPVFSGFDGTWPRTTVKASIYGFAHAQLVALEFLRLDTFEARLGGRFSLDGASAITQVEDEDYASTVDLALHGLVKAGCAFQTLNRLLRIQAVEAVYEITVPLAASPKGSVTANPRNVAPDDGTGVGEYAYLSTRLQATPSLLPAIGIEGVRYYRQENGDLDSPPSFCNLLLPPDAGGTNTFTCRMTFPADALGQQTFYAFTEARVFGVRLPFPLEVNRNAKSTLLVDGRPYVAVRTGDAGIVEINPYCSVNHLGTIALTATDSNGLAGVFTVDDARNPRPMAPAASGRAYEGAVVSTGTDYFGSEVAVREKYSCPDCPGRDVFFARRWRTDGSGVKTTVASSNCAGVVQVPCELCEFTPDPCDFSTFCPDDDLAPCGFCLVQPLVCDFNSFVGAVGGIQDSNNIDVNATGEVVFPALIQGQTYTRVFVGDGSTLDYVLDYPGLAALWPAIADNGRVVLRTNNFRIFVYDRPYGIPRAVAFPNNGFLAADDDMGRAPNISPNGQMIVFIGTLTDDGALIHETTPGVGVFAARYRAPVWEITRLVGLSGNGYLDPNEDHNDVNGNGSVEIGEDEGVVTGLEMHSRVGLTDDGFVVFVGRDQSDNKCVFGLQLFLYDDSTFVNPVFPISCVGSILPDGLGGLLPPIQDLEIYDPVGSTAQSGVAVPKKVAYWADLGGMDQAIVVSTVRPVFAE